MNDLPLRYGCNPHQSPAHLYMPDGQPPFQVLNGQPSYINILDALTGWQLVRDLSNASGKPAAASYKHVSPAGAAVAAPVSDAFAQSQMLESAPIDGVTQAYVRARGADRVSSFGDAVAVSHAVTVELAHLLKKEVSDCIIAPSYDPEALSILRSKKSERYVILQSDRNYEPPEIESRDVFGVRLEQRRDDSRVSRELFERDVTGRSIPEDVIETILVATIALKYTQSNSVCVAWRGQVIGMAAGQQSRIHCTRLACSKAETWMLQIHPRTLALSFESALTRPERSNRVDQFIRWEELTSVEKADLTSRLGGDVDPITQIERHEWFTEFPGLCLSSDAFIPFRDNLDRAAQSNVQYVAHAGGAMRDMEVREAANDHGIGIIETGLRCFLH
jgi:AICAR transformylase/IMP cyclohydrolase PurH